MWFLADKSVILADRKWVLADRPLKLADNSLGFLKNGNLLGLRCKIPPLLSLFLRYMEEKSPDPGSPPVYLHVLDWIRG
jgi:hypothetical protein